MRHFEFWPPRVFEAPYYLHLLSLCARRGLPVRYLAKANFALDHGELGLGSKYSTQMAFAQARFLPTALLEASLKPRDREKEISAFAEANGYPLIVKPDIGAVGKGVLKLDNAAAASRAAQSIQRSHLLQTFSPLEFEYGVFFIRLKGSNRITGINKKHFPTVVGNGRDSIAVLAMNHYRFTEHWKIFLKYVDTDRVPADGESIRLSFIGSHTMGCKFTDDTQIRTPAMEQAVFAICDSQPGFNFGRLDVKAASEDAFRSGEFVVIEVNGIASLPTHMFDPDNSLRRAYQTFFEHGRYLAEIANEHRYEPMVLKSYREIWSLAKTNYASLNDMHQKAMST